MESSSDLLKRRRYYLRVTAAIDQPPRFCGPYFSLASPLWVFSHVAFHAVIQQPRPLPSCGSAIFSGLGGFHLQLVVGGERVEDCALRGMFFMRLTWKLQPSLPLPDSFGYSSLQRSLGNVVQLLVQEEKALETTRLSLLQAPKRQTTERARPYTSCSSASLSTCYF